MGVNYGFDKARLLHPSGRGAGRGDVRARRGHRAVGEEWQLVYDLTIEIEGVTKPALAATWLTMQVVG